MRSIYDIRVTPTPYTYLKYVNQMCVSTYFLFILKAKREVYVYKDKNRLMNYIYFFIWDICAYFIYLSFLFSSTFLFIYITKYFEKTISLSLFFLLFFCFTFISLPEPNISWWYSRFLVYKGLKLCPLLESPLTFTFSPKLEWLITCQSALYKETKYLIYKFIFLQKMRLHLCSLSAILSNAWVNKKLIVFIHFFYLSYTIISYFLFIF